LRNPQAFYPWLHRIAYRLLLADWRYRRPLVPLDRLRDLLGPAPVLPALTRLLVRESAAELSPALYRVLVLHDELGYTVPEIAAALGISVAATKARLKRARAGMRARYPDEGGELWPRPRRIHGYEESYDYDHDGYSAQFYPR